MHLLGTVLPWPASFARVTGFARKGRRALVSRSAKLGPALRQPEIGSKSGWPRPGAGEAPSLVGLGQKLYRDYLEHLVRTVPRGQVIAAGGEELRYLERHCVVGGQDLIDGIAPALDAFFQYLQSASPGIWNDFTCQDAVTVIHDQLGRIEVLDVRTSDDPARREDAVFGFFLYCSYVFAAAAHGSPSVRYEIGIRSGPLLN